MLIEKCKDTNFYKKGFTLIELAIVIIVMGFLIAGIVGGQSLIRSSEMRSIITDYNNYKQGIFAFKLEYDALPGDFDEATDYFGGQVSRNGNGDGKISDSAWNNHGEPSSVFDHLAAAEIIAGNYQATNRCLVTGGADQVWPESSIKNVYWVARNAPGIFTNSKIFLTLGGHQLDWGNTMNQCGTQSKVLSHEAYNIDRKIDDGRANNGSLQSRFRHGTTLSNDDNCTDSNGEYKKDMDVFGCTMHFLIE